MTLHLAGEGHRIDDGVVLAYPADRPAGTDVVIGAGARLRRGTVIYQGTVIGSAFQTGHNVVIREDNRIGDQVSVWSNSVIDYGCVIGEGVKIHTNCYVSQFSVLEDKVFLAPGVSLANDLYPGDPGSAAEMSGPVLRRGAQLGVNSTVLPYVEIGEGAVIGAGAVVTRDVPPGMIVRGGPARITGAVPGPEEVSRLLALRRRKR